MITNEVGRGEVDIVFVCEPEYENPSQAGRADAVFNVRFAYQNGELDRQVISGDADAHQWFSARRANGAVCVKPDRLIELAAAIRAARRRPGLVR